MAREQSAFLDEFKDNIKRPGGELQTRTTDFFPYAGRAIMRSLEGHPDLQNPPTLSSGIDVNDDLCEWILSASKADRVAAGLDLDRPPAALHHVPGKYPIFYDFHNLDIVLTELVKAGAALNGRLLDFGCSTGRNLAVLARAFGDAFELYGVDPSGPSIDWLNRNIAGVHARQSRQTPPLEFPEAYFDLVIAKSIWTHFSPAAAKSWFAEINRCLKPGGFFFFSTHGPHDVPSRILRDIPRPKYERYTGHPHWTRDAFLEAIAEGFRSAGCFFQAFKDVGHQGDLKGALEPTTSDWGLAFMLPEFVSALLPENLTIVRYEVARTGARHDAYVVRKSA